MEINNNTIVNVCNYMPITIIASTNVEDYVFKPCQTDTPVTLPMSANEIKAIHSKSRIFVDGWLSFEDDVKNDMYKFLKIKDGDNILNQVEIMQCIISGGKDDLAKLINIKSKGYFERVYGVYTALKQSNMYDISMRVAKAIEYRYKELQQGVINTQIELSSSFKTDERDKVIAEQQTLLDEQQKQMQETNAMLEMLKKQLADLQENMNKQNNTKLDNSTDTEQSTNPTPAKRGRPSTKK